MEDGAADSYFAGVDGGTGSKCRFAAGWCQCESKIGPTRPGNPDTGVRDDRNPGNLLGDRGNRMRPVGLVREAGENRNGI